MLLFRKIQNWLDKSTQRKTHMRSAEEWDEQFKSGRWDYLENKLQEVGHYSVIAGYFNYFTPKGQILDVGCGQGVLNRYLRNYRYNKYLGIDISTEAIRKAEPYQDEDTYFIVADVESKELDTLFDCIIFNECLYYLTQPMDVIRKYNKSLTDNGCILISMFGDDEPIQKIWTQLNGHAKPVDSTRVTHGPSDLFWNIAVYKKNAFISMP